MTRARADWMLLAIAVAAFALAWLARDVMTGDITTRAQLIGLGKVGGYLFIALFILQLVRDRK